MAILLSKSRWVIRRRINWYIKEFYELRLKDLNANDLINTLNEKFCVEIVLLCHELLGTKLNKEHFCHRRLLADWIELEMGIIIPEISIKNDDRDSVIEIYDLKQKIKSLIKSYK